jgi:seryl-tRNA synthetase
MQSVQLFVAQNKNLSIGVSLIAILAIGYYFLKMRCDNYRKKTLATIEALNTEKDGIDNQIKKIIAENINSTNAREIILQKTEGLSKDYSDIIDQIQEKTKRMNDLWC